MLWHGAFNKFIQVIMLAIVVSKLIKLTKDMLSFTSSLSLRSNEGYSDKRTSAILLFFFCSPR